MVRNLVVYTFRPETEKKFCEYHSIESHNFYIKRGYICPYCNNGSKPVHKTVIEEMNK